MKLLSETSVRRYIEFEISTILITQKIENLAFGTFGPNWVIPAWKGHELSRGQAIDTQTDIYTHTDITDTGNEKTKAQNLPGAKSKLGQKLYHEN